jgi:hypothetical protein
MSLTTVRSIVDAARARHWAFTHLVLGDGAVLLFVRSRLVTHVATHGPKIEGLVGTTISYSFPLAGPTLLVTNTGSILTTAYGQGIVVNDGLGLPAVGSAYQDGWPVHLDGSGVPYVDFTETPVAGDPFGLNGGTPGFPLPGDMIRLIAATLTLGSPPGLVIPCEILPEAARLSNSPGRNPQAFVSANRLVPIRPYSTASANTSDVWSGVTGVQLSYVGVQQLATLDDVLNLPTVLAEALIADTANMLAMQSRDMPPSEKVGFAREAARCSAVVGDAALDLLNEPMQSSVEYRG